MSRSDIETIFGRALSTLLAALMAAPLIGVVYFAARYAAPHAANWEVERFPVLAAQTIEDTTYPAFDQTRAVCDGPDAIVAGMMSKVRYGAYIPPTGYAVWAMPGETPDIDALIEKLRVENPEGHQVFFGQPTRPLDRAFVVFQDQPPATDIDRPPGVQDWGPWRIHNGCSGKWNSWFTVVRHRPWHGLWDLTTAAGPFPLPAEAQIAGTVPENAR